MLARGRRAWLIGALCLLLAPCALAAKVRVLWTNPTTYTDGAALKALAYETVYWGVCASTSPLVFGGIAGEEKVVGTVPGAHMYAWVFPSGPGPFCFYVTATSTAGVQSDPSVTTFWTPPKKLLAPVQLGAVLHLTPRPPS